MKSSQLVAIIKRLEAMQQTDPDEEQTRHFEKEGVGVVGIVKYDANNQTYELEEVNNHQKFNFDDIDLIAMEIYDLLND